MKRADWKGALSPSQIYRSGSLRSAIFLLFHSVFSPFPHRGAWSQARRCQYCSSFISNLMIVASPPWHYCRRHVGLRPTSDTRRKLLVAREKKPLVPRVPWHKQDIQFHYEASWLSFWTGSFYKSVKVDNEWSTGVVYLCCTDVLLQKFCMQNETNQGHKERPFVLNRVAKLVIFALK